jgi:hypothetical protein
VPAEEQRPNLNLLAELAISRLQGRPAYMVAAAAGIRAPLLSMIVSGQKQPTRATARKIARALRRDVAELFPELDD